MDGLNHAGNRSVQDIAREISERRNRGESPRLDEYIGRFPELAAELVDLFPASECDPDRTTAPGDEATALRLSRAPVVEENGSARAAGGISHSGHDRPRRHGGRLPGPAGVARAESRPQSPARDRAADSRARSALQTRGAGRRPAAPHQHRASPRRRRRPGRPLLRDAVH